MTLTALWIKIRKYVPLWAYPLLAPIYRWRRRRHIAQLEAHDRDYRRARPEARFPPAALRYKVVGLCTAEQFADTGRQTLADIRAALARAGQDLSAVGDFLDFGCGCGRLAAAVAAEGVAIGYVGCDVDGTAIDWCRANLNGQQFVVNAAEPPAPFTEAAFDVVWCGSVFTHLDECRQIAWLAEARRLLRPGGILLASIHGRESWRSRLPVWAARALEADGFLFAKTGADAGIHPDWYQVAWHTEDYVRRRWAEMFEVLAYLPKGFNNHQDIVVCRKPR